MGCGGYGKGVFAFVIIYCYNEKIYIDTIVGTCKITKFTRHADNYGWDFSVNVSILTDKHLILC